ncbi:MAG: transketolase [Candidatus Pacebacteria bacterium]|nr:transketolase [Candidatus Paceibacterota bacterium]MBP9772557.1 transketolase [Candidatus Paceibacterota bacterium]
MLSDKKIEELELKANDIRKSIIEMLLEAGSGHTAGPLGMSDIFTLLFFHILKHDPKKSDWSERDRVVLSNGHICPVYYATMAHAGYFPLEELKTLRKFGSRLQGHPHREFMPWLETSSGPLGSGLSQAVGMAIADRIDNTNRSDKYFYCLLGDGELNEGNNWEAVMLGAKERLHNLIAIVDRNNIQIDGYTEDIMPLDDLVKKFESFNWHVQEVDGHNFLAMESAVMKAKAVYEKPSIIIARTIPGKGVKEFERDFKWHGIPPNKEQADMALKELRTLGGKIKSEHQ